MCFSTSLVFALLTSVASATALVICVMYGELMIGGVVRQTDILIHNPEYLRDVDKLNAFVGELALSLIFLIAGLFSLICFTFSVILYDGIKRRQPGQIRAYLVFGLTMTGLVVTAAIIHMYAYDAKISRYVLMGCGSYLGCLVMIRVTYHQILAATARALANVTCE